MGKMRGFISDILPYSPLADRQEPTGQSERAGIIWNNARMKVSKLTLAVLVFAWAILPSLWAGPPFLTDDPEPVALHHYEIYTAAFNTRTQDGWTGIFPYVDANYGIVRNVHFHVATPFNSVRPDQAVNQYGYGDTEVGAKMRFLQETKEHPQAAFYPLIEIPTGDEERGLGNGHAQFFLPVWVQKSWGRWTSYGGGGYWINTGSGNKNWENAGWVLQRDISEQLMLGAELYYGTVATVGDSVSEGFNIGGQFNFNKEYHLLLSAGRDFNGPNQFISYLALQWTYPAE